MKFTINVEMTPEELRRTLGWPDVGAVQDEVIEQLRAQMKSGEVDYDPLELMKTVMRAGAGNAETFQKMLLNMMQYGQRDREKS